MPIKGEPNLFHKEYFYQEPDNPILPIGSQDLPPFGPPYEDSEKVFESIKNSEHKNYVDKPENSHTYENNFIESYQSTLFRKTPRQKLKFQREAPTFETNVNEFNQYKPDYEPAIDDIAAPSPLYESDDGQYGGYEFPKFESKHEEINFGNSVKSKINGKFVSNKLTPRPYRHSNPSPKPTVPTRSETHKSPFRTNPDSQNNLNLVKVSPTPESVGYQFMSVHDSEFEFEFPKDTPSTTEEPQQNHVSHQAPLQNHVSHQAPQQNHVSHQAPQQNHVSHQTLKEKRHNKARDVPKHQSNYFNLHTASTGSVDKETNKYYQKQTIKDTRSIPKTNSKPTKLTKPYISVKPRGDQFYWEQKQENSYSFQSQGPIKVNEPNSGNYFTPTSLKLAHHRLATVGKLSNNMSMITIFGQKLCFYEKFQYHLMYELFKLGIMHG